MLPALLSNARRASVVSKPSPVSRSVQKPTRTYYRAGRPYKGRKLPKPLLDATMNDPFRPQKSQMDWFGKDYVRNSIRDPEVPFKEEVENAADFIYSSPALSGRHCMSIQMNQWTTDNALSADSLVRLRDLIYKFATNNLYWSIVWKATRNNLCTGVDLYAMYNLLHTSDSLAPIRQYYKTLYESAYYLSTLEKPFIPILSGAVSGAGAGLALSGMLPIATESSRVSLPGCAYGSLGPEGGISFKMSRLPGRLGEYFMITGKTIHSADLCHVGLAHFFMPGDRTDELEAKLSDVDSKDLPTILASISYFTDVPDPSTVLKYQKSIDRCFGMDTVAEIMQALREETEHVVWAQNTLKRMEENSPLAMAITLRATRIARHSPLLGCINMEYAIMSRLIQSYEFSEGISAFVESRQPNWTYSKPENVPASEVEKYLAPLSVKNKLRLDKIVLDAPRIDVPSEIDRAKHKVPGLSKSTPEFVQSYGGPYAEMESVVTWAHGELLKPEGIATYHSLLNREEEIFDVLQNLYDDNMPVVNHTSQN